ncbi:MAG: ion transporter [Candidatus Obscuribacterales bacterium]|jgi:voltage-gated potassium channel|nr:ion transporter [Candidatus Obscuribacterales bacterium]
MQSPTLPARSNASLRQRVYQIVFESDTFAGRVFDVCLLIVIIVSVVVVMLDSIASVRSRYSAELAAFEWGLTALFSIEYIARVYCAKNRPAYFFGFFGIIDLLSVLPTYLGLLFGGAHYLMVVRILRLLRIFRIFKLSRYLSEADVLMKALTASRAKITVFLGTVLTLVVVIGALMYLIEGPENGFTSIPRSIYWSIVTLTTVGYGDIAPKTPVGQFIACIVMILGYGIIAVPTGIVSVELQAASKKKTLDRSCSACGLRGHQDDASFCRNCGSSIESN